MIRLLFVLVPLVVLSLCPISTAQVCIRGRPSPECQFIVLTEANFTVGQREGQLTSEFGGVYNLNERHALGGSVFLNWDYDRDLHGSGHSEVGMGIKARYRYWLGYPFSLDVAPGLLLTGTDLESPSFVGHVALNYTEWIGLIAQVDRINSKRPEPTSTDYSLGIKVGSYAGLPVMIGAALLVLYGFAIYEY